MVMETVDLGDRRELIDLIYGPQKPDLDKTPTASSTTLTPRTENEKIKKPKKKNLGIYIAFHSGTTQLFINLSRVVCSYTTILLLFILAAAAVLLSGFISYWYTRQEYEMKLAALPFASIPRRNMTKLMREEEITYEEEEPREGPTMEELRLPDTVEPIWYNMTLKMYLPGYVELPEGKNFTTDGNIMIKLDVKQPTTEIVLNAKDLSFPMDANKVKILTERLATRGERQVMMDDSSELEMENTTSQKIVTSAKKVTVSPVKRLELIESGTKVKNIVYNSTLEKVSFILDGSLEAGNPVILQLPFNGQISNNLTGLFVSSYMKSDGQSRLAAITDIQPGSARKLFPCFDEPRFKAPLSLTILHPKGTTATANAMEITDGQATSDPMWLKTSFDVTRPLPTSLTAFTLTDFEKAQTTTDTGAKRYLAVPPRSAKLGQFMKTNLSPLQVYSEKMIVVDVFALPELAKAEMSGDGLILVREDRLLYDPKLDTIEGKMQVAQTICYEFTKQWFGNVMGKSDLRDLWMNDAMAKYMDYICLENLFTGLDKDFLKAHHADKNAKSTLWDAWNNVVPQNLKSWDGEKLNITDFMDKWIKQMGYPVVEVYRIDDLTVELTQRRFKVFILEKLKTVFNTIDFDSLSFADGEDFLESRTKREIVQLYCKLSPDDCTKKLTHQFETNVMAKCSNKTIASVCSSVPPSGRSMVYCAGVAQGGDMEFKQIHQLSRTEVNAAEQARLIDALACSRDPRKLRKLMYECVKPGKASLHKSDVYPLIAAMSDQLVGAEVVSDFILDNWKELTDRFSQDRGGLTAVLERGVSLNSEREIKQFERFLVDHKSSARDLDVLKRQLEIARNRQHWIKMNRKALEAYMGSKRVEREL
ncbi:peptidase family M1 [Teladorsagia circumcincta]|uniref:Peptidase family M1 n=1 Tax=Teladorsagia circumcincta TaxID=45464 RepID=A0A2G9UAC9_TELCI|nr:peptidase family M1 [Teladorsagia circumcincta]